MTWYLWALLGALVWSVHYNFLARVMQVASPLTVYFIPTILLLIGLPLYYKSLISDFRALYAAEFDIKAMAITIAFTSIIASVAVYKAIQGSNATVASLIEITYPVFVALFAYFILKENHLTPITTVGGLFILAGVSIIIWEGR